MDPSCVPVVNRLLATGSIVLLGRLPQASSLDCVCVRRKTAMWHVECKV